MAKSYYVCGMEKQLTAEQYLFFLETSYICDSYKDKLSKSVLLHELDITRKRVYEKASWDDILVIVQEVEDLNIPDVIVQNIVEYVHKKNKISEKQYMVLRNFIMHERKKQHLNFKYGK